MCKREVKKCLEKLLGVLMVIFSPVTVGLGIADVAITSMAWCTQSSQCGTLTDGLALTWVAVGIWAPIPIFINGIAAIWISGRPNANRGWICLLSFMNTVAFGPALVIITALELSKKFSKGAPSAGTYSELSSVIPSATAAFGIEIVICIVGFILWLHALAVLYLNCCCRSCLAEEMEHTASKQQPAPQSDPEPAPQSNDVDRMNVWSAYRWMNNGGAPSPCSAAKPNYYAVGAPPCRCGGIGAGAVGPYGVNYPVSYQIPGKFQ